MSTGQIVVEYTYDAWGNILNISGDLELGTINPLRYRGYFYDNETKLYFLQTRYYDPSIGRFINADGQLNGNFLGLNMYAYCENNPVNMCDCGGNCPHVPGAKFCDICALQSKGAANAALAVEFAKQETSTAKASNPTKVSNDCVEFIKGWEAFYSKPYDDGYGNMTIGYGHLIGKSESFTIITKEEATLILLKELVTWEKAVSAYANKIGMKLTQNQFDALVSLGFNAGYSFQKVMDRIANGENPYDVFGLYVKASGKVAPGLVKRRKAEADIYVKKIYDSKH